MQGDDVKEIDQKEINRDIFVLWECEHSKKEWAKSLLKYVVLFLCYTTGLNMTYLIILHSVYLFQVLQTPNLTWTKEKKYMGKT